MEVASRDWGECEQRKPTLTVIGIACEFQILFKLRRETIEIVVGFRPITTLQLMRRNKSTSLRCCVATIYLRRILINKWTGTLSRIEETFMKIGSIARWKCCFESIRGEATELN